MSKSEASVNQDHIVEIRLRKRSRLSKSCIWVERDNFYGVPKAEKRDVFLVVGFDTEFKTPDEPLSNLDVRLGTAKYTVLSYQVHCKLYDPRRPNTAEWGAICYPKKGARLSLAEVLTFAVWKGISSGTVDSVPDRIFLVGHFTRADIPAFSDFQSLTKAMSSVRNTFLSIDGHVPVDLTCADGSKARLAVLIRDTMLLTPAGSKSLRALGELVGVEKVTLSPDAETEQFYKQNMDVLLEQHPTLYQRYALTDAVICVRYVEQLLQQYRDILGVMKFPVTLTSIGLDLLWRSWVEETGLDPLNILGQETVTERFYSKKLGRYVKSEKAVPLREVSWHIPSATECYHGGRNEQFWFGPAFEDDWTDYDLTSAYPTAMALIRTPDWRAIRVSRAKVSDFQADTLGVACVEFEFPKTVRFPTLPVRTDNGLVFPRKGTSDCASPEIALARLLGAKIRIKHGVLVPYRSDTRIFGEFITKCIAERSQHPKGSLRNLFWKELSNSTYGKTAQGLHPKRVYDLRSRDTAPLPPSRITNPFYASYITSFVRAVLGEVINSLPESTCVFSCTTDGFLTNATIEEIDQAGSGPLATLFRESRTALTGDSSLLEVKHRIRRPLGWRTRGQATLVKGADHPSVAQTVLAKGGIFTPSHLDTTDLQNDHIVRLFLERQPDTKIPMTIKTSVRDMVEYDADLVEKNLVRRLSMEFDWKRRPFSVVQSKRPNHIAFSTQPWDTVDEFMAMRRYWEEYSNQSPACIKSITDYRLFAVYVLSQSSLGKSDSRYLRKKDPDIARLRQALGSAWRHSKAGLVWRMNGLSNQDFADLLTECGIPCKRSDVENDSRKPFKRKTVPPTPNVFHSISKLVEKFPNFDSSELIVRTDGNIDLLTAIDSSCLMTSKL